ncbi:copper homeostasis protein CutC [Panacibacter ginsenosidivorans]|uniref:PF03932 family protein CutC n=1 Tax=Panacibacter ginsenosidivorans TaxID=1813871 RepID=A0A5B8VC52_9BACT|nr:copper homeostasis protein CutC [Panacibacter ginsenosidivorans]QEC69014.1 copper homeostasis protein CutC [Panacibacter ginsenosidivorans]
MSDISNPSFRGAGGILEIAVFNINSAIIAANAGADRIELCENPFDGGTTPSYGTLKTVREKISIPVFPIIRPRGGDFLYSDDEYEVMKKDILLCKDLGFEGVVTGILLPDGSIDIKRTAKLVKLAYPLEVTFHRAFDRAKEPLKSLGDVIKCGCQRILTSGQVPNAFDGKELIRLLVEQSAERIIIMPGSGVRGNNIKEIAGYTGATELHSSARKNITSAMEFKQPLMHETLENISVDPSEIKLMKTNIC